MNQVHSLMNKPRASLMPSDAKVMLESFVMFDKDNDKRISKSELATVMRAMGCNPTDQDVADIMKRWDETESGDLDYGEYAELIKDNTIPREEMRDELVIAMKHFDKNKDGRIDVEELTAILVSMGEIMTREEVKETIDEFDENKSGYLETEEFVDFLMAWI